jgi:hypothetical protein
MDAWLSPLVKSDRFGVLALSRDPVTYEYSYLQAVLPDLGDE